MLYYQTDIALWMVVLEHPCVWNWFNKNCEPYQATANYELTHLYTKCFSPSSFLTPSAFHHLALLQILFPFTSAKEISLLLSWKLLIKYLQSHVVKFLVYVYYMFSANKFYADMTKSFCCIMNKLYFDLHSLRCTTSCGKYEILHIVQQRLTSAPYIGLLPVQILDYQNQMCSP